jgi:hypothetical protein
MRVGHAGVSRRSPVSSRARPGLRHGVVEHLLMDDVAESSVHASHRFHRRFAVRRFGFVVVAAVAGVGDLNAGHDVPDAVDLPVPRLGKPMADLVPEVGGLLAGIDPLQVSNRRRGDTAACLACGVPWSVLGQWSSPSQRRRRSTRICSTSSCSSLTTGPSPVIPVPTRATERESVASVLPPCCGPRHRRDDRADKDAWRMVVPKHVAQEYLDALGT